MKKCFIILFFILAGTGSIYAQANTIGSGIELQIVSNVSSYVDLGDVYNTLNFPLTFECWINPSSFTSPYGGIFASDNTNTGNYYGFYVRLNTSGNLIFETGDGTGASDVNRKGKITSTAVALNKWTHIAVVATSISSISIYFNGVLQPISNTDGFSNLTNIIHNSYPASIGRYINVYDQHNYVGQLDEIRLWNTARTQTDIRNNMCKKINSGSSGLIGYWKVDEAYTSSTVNDYTSPSENGTIMGSVVKTTSAAPIGDASSFSYLSSWNGVGVSLSTGTGEKFTAKNINGNPQGVQVYKVNHAPYFTGGLTNAADYYFGVFCAEGNTGATYQSTYLYTTSGGPITINNESQVKLKSKNNGSVATWTTISSNPDTSINVIKKGNQISRGEYIVDVKEISNKVAGTVIDQDISIFPNPASSSISFVIPEQQEGIFTLDIFNSQSTIVYSEKNMNSESLGSIDVSSWSNGIYFMKISTGDKSLFSKFIIQR